MADCGPVPTPTRFDRDTAVKHIDGRRFEARVDPGWWIVRGPNGGYVGAILLRAFTEVVGDPERHARSFTVHFTAPPEAGPVRIETTVERTGRSLTTVSGRLLQGKRLCAVGLAAFSKSREAVEFQDARMPEVPSPTSSEALRTDRGSGVPMRDRYEQRAVIPAHALEAGVSAAGGGWTRLSEPRLTDALLIAALADCWPPALRHRRGPEGEVPARGVPTVDLTVHFRTALPLPDARPDDFYLTVRSSRTITNCATWA